MGAEIALTNEMMLVLGLLALTVGLFVFEIVRVDLAALLVMVLLGLTGLVEGEQLFAGFASNAVISIIAVMIIGAGLDRTGVMGHVAAAILRLGGKTESRIISLVSSSVGVISGFMQNVGATALFLPVVSRIAGRAELPLQRLLMPMGFCAILGGTVTMVGSSPLILLNDLIAASNRTLPPGFDTIAGFELFEVTPIGLALIASGIAYFLVFGRWLLPTQVEESASRETTAEYFAEHYGVQGDIVELVVTADSELVGLRIGEIEADPDAPFLLAISDGSQAKLAPPADEMIWVGTVLGVMGDKRAIAQWAERQHARVLPGTRNFGMLFNPSRGGIAEAVITPSSQLQGQTISEIRFRKRYGVSVLAIHRAGETFREEARTLALQAGDTLVVHAFWRDLARASQGRDFVVVTDFPSQSQRPQKVPWALGFFALAIGMIIFSPFSLPVCLLTGAVGMILTGVISVDDAYQAVSWKTVFLLASLIPLGVAMEITGTAAWIAQEVIQRLGDVPDWVLQAVVAVLATFFTLVMSNVGATVLLVPLAINIAVAADADPRLFALIVALATSNAFILPTHQVNALIMGPGGYRVADFLRVGAPMTLLFLVVMLLMVNVVN